MFLVTIDVMTFIVLCIGMWCWRSDADKLREKSEVTNQYVKREIDRLNELFHAVSYRLDVIEKRCGTYAKGE